MIRVFKLFSTKKYNLDRLKLNKKQHFWFEILERYRFEMDPDMQWRNNSNYQISGGVQSSFTY